MPERLVLSDSPKPKQRIFTDRIDDFHLRLSPRRAQRKLATCYQLPCLLGEWSLPVAWLQRFQSHRIQSATRVISNRQHSIIKSRSRGFLDPVRMSEMCSRRAKNGLGVSCWKRWRSGFEESGCHALLRAAPECGQRKSCSENRKRPKFLAVHVWGTTTSKHAF